MRLFGSVCSLSKEVVKVITVAETVPEAAKNMELEWEDIPAKQSSPMLLLQFLDPAVLTEWISRWRQGRKKSIEGAGDYEWLTL